MTLFWQMSRDERARHLDNARHISAIFTAFMLPLSTSFQAIGVSILAVLSIELLIREPHRLTITMRDPAAYLPVALVALLLIGVTWSMLPSGGALKWVGPYAKLLLIPLLMATAFTPRQVLHVGIGFLAGCSVVLVLSYTSILWPTGPWGRFISIGVPVKDNAVQSECFALCTFGLLIGASRLWTQNQGRRALAATALAALFFANTFMITISRTGALVSLSLIGLLLIQLAGLRRGLMIGVPVLLVIGIALSFTPGVQTRLAEITKGYSAPSNDLNAVSTASRVDFWTKALGFVRAAPLIGHGTGSIRPLYESRETTEPSPYGAATADPHNQFLHVVLQIGLIGGLVLLAMWVSHAVLFFNREVVGMFGLAAVWLNVLGSLFNSHISQVTQGMLYCMAVGLLGALALARGPDQHPLHI